MMIRMMIITTPGSDKIMGIKIGYLTLQCHNCVGVILLLVQCGLFAVTRHPGCCAIQGIPSAGAGELLSLSPCASIPSPSLHVRKTLGSLSAVDLNKGPFGTEVGMSPFSHVGILFEP